MTTVDTGVTLALPIPNAEFIWYCAWTSLISAIYAFSKHETAHFTVVPAPYSHHHSITGEIL